ncbi:MAG: phosphoglucomutase (alpha-D-glucose-1,6-bisphosphate-dependent) [Myxococcota bacterium]|nr:phosphoglucomutase (alpha-D-glucose-1,6-bisphosphate-dependent) [Myxococcota bacterium]
MSPQDPDRPTRHPRAGQPAEPQDLVDVPRLVAAYYTGRPDPGEPAHRVAFGTSGHRGSSLRESFNEPHVLAITQAVCEHRAARGIGGPIFVGKDTHALSEPAFESALEVCAAHGVELRIDAQHGYTPTPAVSHAILAHNRGRSDGLADGIVITPSHNPPEDGGFKYNPPTGGPADTETTRAIEQRANEILAGGLRDVRRVAFGAALRAAGTRLHDYVDAYVGDLGAAIDFEPIRAANLVLGVDPLGGANVAYWGPIAERYGLDLRSVDETVDPRFAFMSLDHDGRIRMDCSSPWAMARLVALKDRFDLAFGNDTDSDRHGIVTRSGGLMPPNHYLTVAVAHLFAHRPDWGPAAAIGKTVVTTALLDRIAAALGREVREFPVGFKWFVDGLLEGALGFAGEESAGAAFLRRDGTVWTTEKDGILLDLLAAEIAAVSGRDPAELYRDLAAAHGEPVYERIDAPASADEKRVLARLQPTQVEARELAGEKILAVQSEAPGNGAAFGGIKVATESGWFAARPSGTEDLYKIYAESFLGPDHLRRLQEEARALVARALAGA